MGCVTSLGPRPVSWGEAEATGCVTSLGLGLVVLGGGRGHRLCDLTGPGPGSSGGG